VKVVELLQAGPKLDWQERIFRQSFAFMALEFVVLPLITIHAVVSPSCRLCNGGIISEGLSKAAVYQLAVTDFETHVHFLFCRHDRNDRREWLIRLSLLESRKRRGRKDLLKCDFDHRDGLLAKPQILSGPRPIDPLPVRVGGHGVFE
jgi:hypothetical protein